MKPVRHRHRGYGRTGATSWDVRKRPNGAECLLSSARGSPHRHTSKEQLKSEHTQDSEHTLNFVSFSLAQFFTRFQSAEKASFDGQVLTSKARMMSESSSLTQTYLHSKHFSPERTSPSLYLVFSISIKKSEFFILARNLCLPFWTI